MDSIRENYEIHPGHSVPTSGCPALPWPFGCVAEFLPVAVLLDSGSYPCIMRSAAASAWPEAEAISECNAAPLVKLVGSKNVTAADLELLADFQAKVWYVVTLYEHEQKWKT